MTNQQIEQLRALIQCEIHYALREERGDEFAFEHNEYNNHAWDTFIDSFNFRITTT